MQASMLAWRLKANLKFSALDFCFNPNALSSVKKSTRKIIQLWYKKIISIFITQNYEVGILLKRGNSEAFTVKKAKSSRRNPSTLLKVTCLEDGFKPSRFLFSILLFQLKFQVKKLYLGPSSLFQGSSRMTRG